MTYEAKEASDRKAYIITGPTSGIGLTTAMEIAKHGTVILVGRDALKLGKVQIAIEQTNGRAITVVCDLSDMTSARHAAEEIIGLDLRIAGLVNNAGIHQLSPTKSSQGWDMDFATNHVGPLVLTESLIPHLPSGANVVFIASGVEDPERKPAVAVGFRGGRYISAEASARGEWEPGGSKLPGGDAYATSKQCTLAAALELARENPRLHINAVEPGFIPNTSLGRSSNAILRFVLRYVLPLLAPHIKYWSTPKQAAQVITKVLMNESRATGVYYDDKGIPMLSSQRIRDPEFTARVISETRALLATFRT